MVGGAICFWLHMVKGGGCSLMRYESSGVGCPAPWVQSCRSPGEHRSRGSAERRGW